ncbi:MAG: ATP-dependent DNA helicase RecG [SAR202 cluster bacterium]|nr:ATP-dependent DNA helicase RecG [SAR202 cluster bacterium]
MATNGSNPRETLLKILALERSRGFRDTAVIGGLDGFLRWHADSLAPQIGPAPAYTRWSPDERARWADDLAKRFEGQTPDTPAQSPPTNKPRPQKRNVPRAAPPRPQKPVLLADDVSDLRGVAGQTVIRLDRLGIERIGDLVFHFPHRHDDFTDVRKIAQLTPGEDQTVVVSVWEATETGSGPAGRRSTQATFGDDSGTVRAIWFNQPWVAKRLRPGARLAVSGKVSVFRDRFVFNSPRFEELDKGPNDPVSAGSIVPVYSATDGLPQWRIRALVKQALDLTLSQVEEFVPIDILERLDMIGLRDAVAQMHDPETQAHKKAARFRLAFDELFVMQLTVATQKRQWREEGAGTPLATDNEALDEFIDSLPFELTRAQTAALDEVLADLRSDRPMRRLLQGDVGSGKTAVAATAMVAAAHHGKQSALMAPTEILAEQHFLTIAKLLSSSEQPADGQYVVTIDVAGVDRPLAVALLLGRQRKRVKDDVRAMIAARAVDIVIGTHALIQESVEIPELALVVVDEQHRFGVMQRASLGGKASRPHVLAMSATPIPRSLALTVYGDLDISVIDELPPGRTSARTRWVETERRDAAYDFIRKEVEAGRQAFIVCPLVEESEAIQSRAAVEEHGRLSTQVFPDLRLGLLHGRMSLQEKEEIMSRFKANDLDVLVSTSVVEVGIDVPNATVMMIDGADRFGLSQLHQFRGRVGRGQYQSYCLLLADSPGEEARHRLKLIERVHDGFELAEEDLKLRGPGDYMGTRQSGLPTLKVATLTDYDILALAKREAARLLDSDPTLSDERRQALADRLAEYSSGLVSEAS